MKLRTTLLSIPAEGAWLDARLSHAPGVPGLVVILVPGTDPATQPVDQKVAAALQRAGVATLMLDLLTADEERRDADARYNVPQMANRLLAATEWIEHQPPLRALPIGLLGSGTASAAAVRAAWKYPGRYASIVCRGGRPDLAGAEPLRTLATPIRVVFGSNDPDCHIAAQAYSLITAERDWQRVAEAGPLLAEGNALSTFNRLAAAWFAETLQRPATAPVDAE
ncbi:MAG: alpha/beta hydrolase [Rhodocyclales bacterium]|nr:alpha/beta hydrolase [Rhodocyclales bacterium]